MLKDFTDVATPPVSALSWCEEMDAAFEDVKIRSRLDTITIQHHMDAAMDVMKAEETELTAGLQRFLNPVPGRIYCGLSRLEQYNKIERMCPDCHPG